MEFPALRTFLVIALLLSSAAAASAQLRYYDAWYFGDSAGLDFANGSPVPVKGSLSTIEGSSSICDPITGALLFYTDGITVWNRNHVPMPNGTGLFGHTSTTQSALIVPHPGDFSLFYIFTADALTANPQRLLGLHYSLVDMDEEGGMGDVVQKNVPLLQSATEKLVGVRHAGGCGYWIVTHEVRGNRFYAWLLTTSGLASVPVASAVGSLYDMISPTVPYDAGSLKASPDGTMLFASRLTLDFRRGTGELFGFDPATGRVGPKLDGWPSGYGASFSPDNSFLYTTIGDSILQYDLRSGPGNIGKSGKILYVSIDHDLYGALQLGPDGKIYLTYYSMGVAAMTQGVVNRPNLEGAAADFDPVRFRIGGRGNTFLGLPNCIDGYLGETDAGDVSEGVRIVRQGDTTLCRGDSTQISLFGASRYQWTPSQGLSCDDCSNPVITVSQTTTYSVFVYNEQACPPYDTVAVTIRVVEPSAVDAGADTGICLGQSVELHAIGGNRFQWVPFNGLSCVDCSSPMATPLTTTTYTVYASTDGSCSSVDSVTVQVYDPPTADAGADTAICLGTSLLLHAGGGGRYSWAPSSGLDCDSCADPTARPMETTVYHLLVVDEHGCTARDSVRVVVVGLPVADAGGDTVICKGASVRLSAQGGAIYRWDPSPDLSCLDCSDPLASPTVATKFYVTAVSAEGCEGRDSVEVVVRPGIVVDAGEDRAICLGDTTAIGATGTGGVRWLWEPAEGLNCIDCPNPLASPARTTAYRVTAWSMEGCEATDDVEVIVRETPEIIHLRIGRAYHGMTGDPITIGVEIADIPNATDIAELVMELNYDSRIMQIDVESILRLLAGTVLEGWTVEIRESAQGRLVLHLIAPPGTTLSGGGELLRFEGRLYLSNVRGTELPFTVRSPSRCFAFESEAGYAMVDSICGLNLRLIELTAQKYIPPVVYPNPAHERMTFEFGLGLDGPTRLEVFDALGNRVGLIADEVLASGRYSVEWDVRDVVSGVYWYRLTSGDWSEGGQVRVR